MVQAGTLIRAGFARSQEDLFDRDFVFHFFNPNREDLHGDHGGNDGFRGFYFTRPATPASTTSPTPSPRSETNWLWPTRPIR